MSMTNVLPDIMSTIPYIIPCTMRSIAAKKSPLATQNPPVVAVTIKIASKHRLFRLCVSAKCEKIGPRMKMANPSKAVMLPACMGVAPYADIIHTGSTGHSIYSDVDNIKFAMQSRQKSCDHNLVFSFVPIIGNHSQQISFILTNSCF